MVIELIQLIWLRGQGLSSVAGFAATPEGYSNTKALGAVLYTEHVYAFEIAASFCCSRSLRQSHLTMRKRPVSKFRILRRR